MSETQTVRPPIRFGDVVLDTDDPPRLAEFYSTVLDWEIIRRDEDWWTISPDGGTTQMSFQLALNHRPPSWPANEVPQQFHLDLDVPKAELSGAVDWVQSVGATMADNSSSEASFVVLLDPSGHPFCLCAV